MQCNVMQCNGMECNAMQCNVMVMYVCIFVRCHVLVPETESTIRFPDLKSVSHQTTVTAYCLPLRPP